MKTYKYLFDMYIKTTNDARKKEIFEFLGTCNLKDFETIFDTGMFNEMVKCYCKKALENSEISKEKSKEILAELEQAFSDFKVAELNKKIEYVEINKLSCFQKENGYEINNKTVKELINSINEIGLINPIIVRPLDNGMYEILSGHTRTYACYKLDYKTIPAYIVSINDEEATDLYYQSNIARPDPSIIERAYLLKYEYEKAKRNPEEWEKIAYGNTLPYDGELIPLRTVRAKISLTELSNRAKKFVNNKKIPIRCGIEMVSLPEEIQNYICDSLALNQNCLTKEMIVEIKSLYFDKCLPYNKQVTIDDVEKIIEKGQLRDKEERNVRLFINNSLFDLLPDASNKKEKKKMLEEMVELYAEDYCKRKEREELRKR